MAIRNASAVWNGTLKEGNGSMKLGSGAFEGAFTFASRFEEGPGTNPEELVGAAQAGCFPQITLIELETEAEVPNVDEKTFLEKVDISKKKCPISLALTGPELRVSARLVK